MTALLLLCLLSAHLVASQETTAFQCQQGPKASALLKDCASGLDACMATKDDSTIFGPRFATTSYACRKQDYCPPAFSLTIADGRNLLFSSACCTESGCNTDLEWGVPEASWLKNGLTCPYGCYAQTKDDCKAIPVSCRDSQDACINATGISGAKTFIVMGCGTRNMCDVENFALEIAGIPYNMSAISCDTKPVTTPKPGTTLKPATTPRPATTQKPAASTTKSSASHILGQSSFLLLLPTISSVLLMKFLS